MSSQLKKVGVGIALTDKHPESVHLHVYPYESLPLVESELKPDHFTTERTTTDANGNSTSTVVQKGLGVKATWIKDGNRINAPHIRKGERVDLYQLGDTDQYFFAEAGKDKSLRKTETVNYAWGALNQYAKRDKDLVPTHDNQYSFCVDTNNQHMTVSTSMANGEKAKYTGQFNGKDGHFTITDHTRTIQINSVDDAIVVTNGVCTVMIEGAKIIISGGESVTVTTPHLIVDADKNTINGSTEFIGDVTVNGQPIP